MPCAAAAGEETISRDRLRLARTSLRPSRELTKLGWLSGKRREAPATETNAQPHVSPRVTSVLRYLFIKVWTEQHSNSNRASEGYEGLELRVVCLLGFRV